MLRLRIHTVHPAIFQYNLQSAGETRTHVKLYSNVSGLRNTFTLRHAEAVGREAFSVAGCWLRKVCGLLDMALVWSYQNGAGLLLC